MGIAWEGKLPQNEKFVLLAYADHADHEGNGIFPSIGLIAWKTGYSTRNVTRIKQGLIKKGILVQTGTKDSGTQIYRIDTEKIPKLPDRKRNFLSSDNLSPHDNLSPPPDTRVTPPLTPVSPPHDIAMSPEPSLTTKETSGNQPPKNPSKYTTQQLLFGKLALICKIDLDLMTPNQESVLTNTSTRLDKAGVQPDQIDSFATWWDANDWRGQKGSPPTPGQVIETWGQFKASQGPGKKRGQRSFSKEELATIERLRAMDEKTAFRM